MGFGTFGFVSNSFTSVYISRNFDITKHVFTLLFIDALFSTCSCIISVLTDLLFKTELLKNEYAYCVIQFFVVYYSSNFGALLTMLIAIVRYYLTIQSSKNIIPSNYSVSVWTLLSLSFVVIFNVICMAINIRLDVPIAILTEGCASHIREPRRISVPNMILILVINVYNITSLIVDILVLAFLKKKILPSQLNTVTRGLEEGF
jgi:hypothetical protein